MRNNLLKRLGLTVFVLIGVTLIAFVLMRLGGGDPAVMMAGGMATKEEVQDYRVRMGLDQSYLVQYLTYMNGILHGDLGYSWSYHTSVGEVLSVRLVQTFNLTLFGFFIASVEFS